MRSKQLVYDTFGNVIGRRKKYIVILEGVRRYRLKIWALTGKSALRTACKSLMDISQTKGESMQVVEMQHKDRVVWDYIEAWKDDTV